MCTQQSVRVGVSLLVASFAIWLSADLAQAATRGRAPPIPPPRTTPRPPTPHIPPIVDGAAACGFDPSKPFRELVISGRGVVLPGAYRCVARNYNRPGIVDWRLGPRERDFHAQPQNLPTVYGPDSRGLWPFGINPEPSKCRLSQDLPVSDEDERRQGMKGNGWQTAGQMIFAPDQGVEPDFRYGISNTRAGDGNFFDTGGLCLRMIPSWTPDWWNRNNIGAAATPEIRTLLQRHPSTPLPPVAIARNRTNTAQVGFAAFVDGTIVTIRTGNGGFENDDQQGVRLPAGMVPTAMAVTPYNEFLLVTVWDSNTISGKLAVIALRTRQMAVGNPSQTSNTRYYWGLPGAWTVTNMKLLGFVDLPFATPMAIDASNNVISGNPRGISDNDDPAVGDLSRQAARDLWASVPWNTAYGDDFWRQTARYGYAVVSSRLENKVSFVDLSPLFTYYRSMYLTTAAKYAETTKQGPGASQWPYTFAQVPAQRPTVATTLDVPQPTAVRAGIRSTSIFGITRSDAFTEQTGDDSYRTLSQRTAYVATLDGHVRMYDVSKLALPPSGPRTVPTTPLGSFDVGRNPVAFANNTSISTAPDDLFVISRADRSVTYAFPDGTIQGVLKDKRMIDPVGGSLSMNQAGFGGRGPGRAVFSVVMTITDFNGRQLVDYGVNALRDRDEQYPFVAPGNKPVLFLFGSQAPTQGRPFQMTVDEVI